MPPMATTMSEIGTPGRRQLTMPALVEVPTEAKEPPKKVVRSDRGMTAADVVDTTSALKWIKESGQSPLIVLPRKFSVATKALVSLLGEAGLLSRIPVALIDPTDGSVTPRAAAATDGLFVPYGIAPAIFRPDGCSTTADFETRYGRDLYADDPELYSEVVWKLPVAEAMALFRATLRISARISPGRRRYNPSGTRLLYKEEAWMRCDPLAALAKADLAEDEVASGKLSIAGHAATPAQTQPKMLLVGAGPGNPNLLTVAAVKALQEADVVLADRLVSPDILKLASGRVELIAKKTIGNANPAQNELNNVGLNALKQGLSVVRLKGGDPFVFGRGGEEAQFYHDHGFPVGVIPGISSPVAAAACAGIPVTSRGFADQLLITSAHGSEDRVPDLPPFSDHCTYVFLMGVARLRRLSASLIKHGYPVEHPVAIVQEGSLSSQRLLKSTLNKVAAEAAVANIKSPSVIIVGHVVNALNPAAIVDFPALNMDTTSIPQTDGGIGQTIQDWVSENL